MDGERQFIALAIGVGLSAKHEIEKSLPSNAIKYFTNSLPLLLARIIQYYCHDPPSVLFHIYAGIHYFSNNNYSVLGRCALMRII